MCLSRADRCRRRPSPAAPFAAATLAHHPLIILINNKITILIDHQTKKQNTQQFKSPIKSLRMAVLFLASRDLHLAAAFARQFYW